LLVMLLSACSPNLPAHDFTSVEPPEKNAAALLAEASTACKEQTRKKGIGSILGIFSRLRPGSADADYVACMKERGYAIRQ
jgi:hypothetical protein